MRINSWHFRIGLLVLTVLLAACGGTTDGPQPVEPVQTGGQQAVASADFVFGVVLVGSQDDHSWSQSHVEAGRSVEQNMPGSAMLASAPLTPDNPGLTLEGVASDMISQGAKLVFVTSPALEDAAMLAAQQHPDVAFVVIGGDDAWTEGQDPGKALPNLGNLMVDMTSVQHVAGCAAGLATQTGRVGYLGAVPDDQSRRFASAAYLGANYCYHVYGAGSESSGAEMECIITDVGVVCQTGGPLQFEVAWVGSQASGVVWSPAEATRQLISNGADVVLSQTDLVGQMPAVAQQAAGGARVLGAPYGHVSACDAAAEVCLGVPFYSWGSLYLEIAQAVKAGTWSPAWEWRGPQWSALADRNVTPVGWISGPGITPEQQIQLNTFAAALAGGDLDLYAGPLHYQNGSDFIQPEESATLQQRWYMPMLLEGMQEVSR